jgi:hypothetical protein
MVTITYEKHDKEGNWTTHTSQGFSDLWLAYKEAALLTQNNNNIANVKVLES